LARTFCAEASLDRRGGAALPRPGVQDALANALKDLFQADPARGEPALLAWAEFVRAVSSARRRVSAGRFVAGEANWRAMVTAHAGADLGIPLADFQAFWNGFALHLLSGLLADAPHARVFHALECGFSGAVGAYWATVRNAPLLVQDQGVDPVLPTIARGSLVPIRRRLERLLAQIALKGATAITVPDAGRRDRIIGLGATPDRISIVPPGVPAAPQERGLGHARPLVAFAESHTTYADRTICLRIAAEIRRATPDAEFLLFAGPDTIPSPEFRALLADYGLAETLTVVPAMGPAPAIERPDILILPDARETIAPAALLAGAHRVCVLAGSLNAAARLLETECILTEGGVSEFADRAVRLLKNPAARRVLAQNLHEKVERRHSLGKSLAAYDRVYRELLDRANLKQAPKEAA
jgi:glycosyltransferase involved in cell wall biosynthesis